MSERAAYVAQKGQLVVWELPRRELKPEEVYVEVKAVGIEPIDVNHLDKHLADGCVLGCNFAGIVVAKGEQVKRVSIGDAVAGGAIGGNVDLKEDGAFTKLVKVPEHVLIVFPGGLDEASTEHLGPGSIKTFEQAASIGVDVANAAVAVSLPQLGDAQVRTHSAESVSSTAQNIFVSQLSPQCESRVPELGYFWLQQPVKKLGTKAVSCPQPLQDQIPAVFELIAKAPKLQAGAVEIIKGFDSIPSAVDKVRTAATAAKIVVSV